MRKRVFGRQLGRNRSSRKALFRSLMRALVLEGAIETTPAKAKAVRGEIDKLVKLAGDGSLNARRRALSLMGNDEEVVGKLFGAAAELTKGRKSGFTRMVRVARRRGDNAEIVKLFWVVDPDVKAQAKKIEKKEKKK